MIPGRHQPDPEELKTLVAEQPGLFWSLFAMIVALFVGLAFRATFSPEKITHLIQVAAKNIHPDVNVQFQRAYLSLSDGFLPELAVVIENVTADSEQSCWGKPQVKIDAVRLPLEMIELFRGRVRLATVEIGSVDATLRTDFGECGRAPASVAEEPKALSAAASPAPATKPLDVQVTQRNPVRYIFVDSVRVHGPSEKWMDVELRRLKVNVLSEQNRVQGRGLFVLPLEAGVSPQADFSLVLEEAPSPQLSLEMNGIWREGRFKLNAKTDLQTRMSEVAAEAQHLPLNQVLELLRRERVIDRELNGRQAWLSLRARTPQAEILDANAKLQIEDFKIEGDLGEIESSGLVLQKLSPLEASPFSMGLRGVKLDKLLSFLDLAAPSPMLGDLGAFNGELRFQNSEHFELSGEHSGLQFIFANRGQREMQTLSLVGGRARFEKGRWDVMLDRIRPLEGLFLGTVRVQADQPWKKVKVDLDMDEFSLSPDVQKLMTGGGSLGRWSGQVAIELAAGKVQDLRGQVLTTEVVVENLAVDRGQIALSSKQGEIQLDMQGKRLRLAAPSPLLDALKPFLDVSTPVETDQLRLILRTKGTEDLSWKLAPVKVGAVALASEGRWDEGGVLKGELVRSEKNQDRKWFIKGTREKPVFEPGSAQ